MCTWVRFDFDKAYKFVRQRGVSPIIILSSLVLRLSLCSAGWFPLEQKAAYPRLVCTISRIFHGRRSESFMVILFSNHFLFSLVSHIVSRDFGFSFLFARSAGVSSHLFHLHNCAQR